MRKIFFVLLVFMLMSCSENGTLSLEMELPAETHIEELFSETAYFTLTVFDGEKVRRKFINAGIRKMEINVHRGSLILVMLEPPEGYSPMVAWYEPGERAPVHLRYDGAALVETLMHAAEKRPRVVRNLSLSAALEHYGELDSVSPTLFLSYLEKGSLDRSSPVTTERQDVIVENMIRGIWVSDRDDTDPVRVVKSGWPVKLRLYPGERRFLLMEKGLVLRLDVGSDGSVVSSVGIAPKWS